ncbi:MAG TPA: heavy-metal-associated domain-containing protein [Sphingomonadaceae bacterium]|nr:heavy-metal-associated domain-containing protein [Sphingomonadaceae bacterium]
MTTSFLPFRELTQRPIAVAALIVALAAAALLALQAVRAQVEGERGITPVASSSDINVSGIEIDVHGDSPQDAREKGWKLAQRLGWERLDGPDISDSQLEAMVAAVVIESEQVGPRRYIATLGISYDRTKAGPLLGSQTASRTSAPMLTIPVLRSGGTYTVYEVRNPWQRAWAEFQTGTSAIDYVRPSGAGGDSLLLNYGQLGRRSRSWWRNILDEFGAADVLVPVAELSRQWPGGPVRGRFTARYGPDNRYIDDFTLEAENEDGVGDMLEAAIARFDEIYTGALDRGLLTPDPTLREDRVALDPVIAELIASERRIREAQENAANAAAQAGEVLPTQVVDAALPQAQTVSSFVVQFSSPDGSSVDAALSSVRGAPGVRGAATSSIAIGGVSVMRVSYAGDIGGLAAALRSRGWNVAQSGNSLSISR